MWMRGWHGGSSAYRFACSLYGKYTSGSEPGEMMLNLGSNTLIPCAGGEGRRAEGEGSEMLNLIGVKHADALWGRVRSRQRGLHGLNHLAM